MTPAPLAMPLLLTAGSIAALCFAGIWYVCLRRQKMLQQFSARLSGFYRRTLHKYFAGDFCDALLAGGFQRLSTALGAFDASVIDRASVDRIGAAAQTISRAAGWCDAWILDGSVRFGARVFCLLAIPARLFQTGRVQGYILVLVAGLIGFLGYAFYIAHHALRW
ncbi:MAG: hypothetical protein WBS18_09965 [Candidatus Acidiferrales bacterium]